MRMKTLASTGLGLLGLTLMMACSSTASSNDDKEISADDPRRGEAVNRICFNRSIDRFSTVSDRQVILQASPSRSYLVETGSCFQLDRAQRIGLDSTGGCLTRGDKLIVSEELFGGGASAQKPDRCFIRGMYEWNPDAAQDEAEK